MVKKLVIYVLEFFVVMLLVMWLFGCSDNSKEAPKEKTTETAVSWDDMIPDYNKIFKNGTITTKYATGTTKDEVAGAYFVIEDVTQEEYEVYIKEAAKMYPNVISQSFDTDDGYPYGMFYANDDITKHSVLITLDEDQFSKKLACNITCETYKTEDEEKNKEDEN